MSTWIGVDLDGTLAHYDGWRGPEHIGAPVPAMVERVKRWLAEGREVRIFTARVSENQGLLHLLKVRQYIDDWVLEHVGQRLAITNQKDFGMVELWDDRAVQVVMNTGEPVGYSTRGL